MRRFSVWIWLVVILLGVVGAGIGSRWTAVAAAYDADDDTPPALTTQHVAALRGVRFVWAPLIEAGGPKINPAAPYGHADIAADLAPIIGTDDPVAVARFHMQVSHWLIRLLRTAGISPGRYALKHLDNAGMETDLRERFHGLPAGRIEAAVAAMPRLEPGNSFELTEEHISLIHRLAFEMDEIAWYDVALGGSYPVPSVDFKRPFGDSTDFEYDMASILDLHGSPSEDRTSRLDVLYWELWPALQVFVENAAFDAEVGES